MMKRWSWIVALLFLVWVLAPQVQADDRLKVTGYVDNHIRVGKNAFSTAGDDDFTNDDDEPFEARTRARLFFHIQGTEDAKAVIAFEMDQKYGDTNRRPDGGDWGLDNIRVELKRFYVDGRIPGTPVNYKVGGLGFVNTPMKNCLILCLDGMGIAIDIPFSDQVGLYTWLSWAQEDFDEDVGDPGTLVGEDYGTGFTLKLAPVEGLDVHPLFVFQHLSGPEFSGSQLHVSTGQDREDRFFLGFDARYRSGNLTFHPSFIYQGGTRDFDGASDSDLSSFLLDLLASYAVGPLKLSGRFVYTPGNEADDDIGGGGDDINFFQTIYVDTGSAVTQWFEIWGINIDSTSVPTFGFDDPRSLRSNTSFDQFGLILGAVRADYQMHPKVSLSGAVGFFWAAEDVGRPARLGTGTGFDDYNYTGDDTYLATEIDAWLSYEIYPRTTVNVWFAYAINGDAVDLGETCNASGCTGGTRDAEDSYGAGARMIYRF